MSRIKTPITGITTTSSYDEGSCYSLVNLRPKNGALYPVAPRKVMQELSLKYDIVFVHQNNDYKNWIGVINDGNHSSVCWDIFSEEHQNIQSDIQGKINSVQQIGNTVSLITSDKIYYSFYQNGNYTFLGEIPQIPLIKLATSPEMRHVEYRFVDEYGSGTIKSENFLDATKGLVNKAIDVLMNGGTNNEESIGGYGLQLFDACFIRYAFRLYDGSLTKHSPPILVMPVKDILELKTIDYNFFKGSITNDSKVDVYGYRIHMYYDFTKLGNDNFDKWEDIIKSVDIFLSPPVGISNIEKIRKDMPTKDLASIPLPLPIKRLNLIKELTPEALKNVANTSTFYLVRSVDLGKKAISDADELPSKDEDFSTMDNLIHQELMTDDNFSNHTYGAETSYAYNNRLHIANIRTTFFKGFNLGYFQWLGNYNNEVRRTEQVNSYITEIEIQAGASLQKVYSEYIEDPRHSTTSKVFAGAFISYPDARARRMTLYEIKDNICTLVFTAPLKPHNLLNIAFFVNKGLKPIISELKPITIPLPDTSKTITLSEPNKLKVSELNNSLSFPNANTYQVGNGTILAMATNAMNVSDRNYGQYPLYIFTTQGVWNLNVGSGEVVYSAQSAPTSTEVPVNSIVESTPFGVVFVSARGLMIINGQNVTFISPQIEQPYKKIEQETNSRIEELLHTFEKQTFSEYLKKMSGLVYNPYENELIIYNKESGFNYVLNFYIQSFYQSTEVIDNFVKNTFPDLYVIGDNKLKHYLESETKRTHVSFMLRPFTYGNDLTKWLQNVKIPFTLYNVERMFVGIYASSDNVKFTGRYGKFYEAMSRAVSYDTKTMASNTARYFLLSFAAILDDDSYLDIIDSEVTTKYHNM